MSNAAAKRVPWILAVLGIIALAALFTANAGRERPMEVSATRPARLDLSSWVSSNGKVEPIEPHVLQSQLTTFIDKVFVKEGQNVSQGQALLTLDAKDIRTELAHSKEQLASAQEEQHVALAGGSPVEIAQINGEIAKLNDEIKRLKKDSEMLERLVANNAATRRELDENKAALDRVEADRRTLEQKKIALSQQSKNQASVAGHRAEEARTSIRSLDTKLAATDVKILVSGTLYSLPAKAGAFVHTGDVLAELADLNRVRVRAFVDEPELGSLSANQPVEITWDAAPNRKWPGQVEQLPKTIVARGSRSVGEVLCSVDNADLQLLPNTNVNVRIRTGERDKVLAIPRAAVRSDGDTRYVFVVDSGNLRRRDVSLGISNATMYEVIHGVTESDLIALSGPVELREGLTVSVRE
jgi:HlyD family secretion protein